jgi:hypothetical protein
VSATQVIESRSGMASRWRRRRMCVLVADLPVPAALRTVSATSAFLETNARPAPGAEVRLRHPEAGTIDAVVDSVSGEGVALRFACSERSVAFALAAIAADMTRPA